MAVAVSGIGELKRHVGVVARVVVSRALGQELLGEFGADHAREEVVQHDPLVVPAHHAPRALEQVGRGNAVGAEALDHGVVEAAEGEVELSHDHMGVVPQVADDGGALRVPLHVVGQAGVVPAEEELGRVFDIEEVGRTGRSGTVEKLEIDLLAACVPERCHVRVVDQGRAIGRDVVSDELAEEGPARRAARVVGSPLGERRSVAGAALASQGVEQRLFDLESGQLREEPAIGLRRGAGRLLPRWSEAGMRGGVRGGHEDPRR